MKRCPQCFQTFSDENSFCLSDGTTLNYIDETPTIFSQAPIIPPIPAPHSVAKQGSNTAFILLGAGLLVFLLALGGAFWLIKSVNSSADNSNISKREEDLKRKEQELAEAEKQRLQREKDELEEKNRQLEEEKSRLQKQKQATPTKTQSQPPSSNMGTAFVYKPTSNVRVSPTGGVLCRITQKITIRTFGSTGVTDNNGEWIYTDACGTMGVIHSTQIQ